VSAIILTTAEKKKFTVLLQGAVNNFQLEKRHEGKTRGEYIKAGAREMARLVKLEIDCH